MPKDSGLVGTPPQHFSSSDHRDKRYNHIEMVRLIGRGTFSQVYLSEDLQTGESIAVKVMDLRRFEDEFNSEVSIMMKLSHQGIDVRYLSSEIDEENETGYIYMDFVPFPTLSEYMESFSYGLKEHHALVIFQNLLKSIEEIHSCRVAHKDLKPENIFVDPDSYDVSVIDFGLSSLVDTNSKDKTFCGSPLYMAPEMLNKEAYDPILADIWSIGVILYEMLLGCNPWSSAENLEDLIEIVNKIEFPNFLSKHAIHLLSGMLRVDPITRDNINKIKSKINSILLKY